LRDSMPGSLIGSKPIRYDTGSLAFSSIHEKTSCNSFTALSGTRRRTWW
jgi:hypothetical protein